MKFRFQVETSPYTGDQLLRVAGFDDDQTVAVVGPLMFSNRTVGDVMGLLQGALECAWALGLRPEGYEEGRAASSGELEAQQRHLADMREIAFATLAAQGVKIRDVKS